jgi:hypothetical protein
MNYCGIFCGSLEGGEDNSEIYGDISAPGEISNIDDVRVF